MDSPSFTPPSSAVLPERHAADWCGRHLRLGAVIGLGLGLLGQVAIAATARSGAPGSPAERLGAVICSTLGWALLAFCIGLATRGLLNWRFGRAAALLLSVTALTAVGLIGVLCLISRALSGSELTVQALQFVVGSSHHFAHAAFGKYRSWLGMLIGCTLGLGLGFARWLYPVSTARGSGASRSQLLAASLGAALLAAGFALRGHSEFLRGMFHSAPVLDFASSFGSGAPEPASSATGADGQRGRAQPTVPAGPSLSAEHDWQRQVAALSPSRPNVLLLQLESVGANRLEQQLDGRPVTPELDQLAREGLRLRRAWTTATHSNYAQMAVLSSLFPYRGLGLDQYERLDYPRFLFHDLFHALGYDTATISSQDETWQGMRRFQDTGTPTFYHHAPDYLGSHLDTGTESDVPDGATTDVVLSWLTAPRNRPWALYVNFQATHFPYSIPAQATRPFGRAEPTASTFNYFDYPLEETEIAHRRYCNALAYVDEQVGRIRHYLELTGELDDTLWIVTADHGENFGDHGLVTHGRTLFDIEARVPLFVRWPGHVEPRDELEPVSHLDIMPTVADLLGLPPHPSYQGRSFVRTRPVDGPAQGIFMTIQGLRLADGLVCWPYKLIMERSSGQNELYDLARDPQERENILGEQPAVAMRLAEVLSAQLRAQLQYHRLASTERAARFAPRLARCPELPDRP